MTLAPLSGSLPALAIAALVVIAVLLMILVSMMAIGWAVSVSPTCSSATRSGSLHAAPPPFTLELPDEWVGGYGDTGWIDALVKHAWAHPRITIAHSSCLGSQVAREAPSWPAAVRGPSADLQVTADDMDPGFMRCALTKSFRRGWRTNWRCLRQTTSLSAIQPRRSSTSRTPDGSLLELKRRGGSAVHRRLRLLLLRHRRAGFDPGVQLSRFLAIRQASFRAIAASFRVPSEDVPATLGDRPVRQWLRLGRPSPRADDYARPARNGGTTIRNGTWNSSPRPTFIGVVARATTLPRRRSCHSHLPVVASTADTPIRSYASAVPTGVSWSAPIPGTVPPSSATRTVSSGAHRAAPGTPGS